VFEGEVFEYVMCDFFWGVGFVLVGFMVEFFDVCWYVVGFEE